MLLQITLLVTLTVIGFVFFLQKALTTNGIYLKNMQKIVYAAIAMVVVGFTTVLALHLIPNIDSIDPLVVPSGSSANKTPSTTKPSLSPSESAIVKTPNVTGDKSSQSATVKTPSVTGDKSSQSSQTNKSVSATAPPVVSPPAAPASPAPPSSLWSQDIVEDFNAPLAASRWNIRNNTYSSNEDSYLLARNVSVDAGVLKIQGKLESAGGRNYTSGYVDTIGKYSLANYFKAEIRAKIPMQQGMWAAPLWFRPEGGGDGEIDLVETLGSERSNPKIHQTIHTEYGATHKQSGITTNYTAVSSSSATDWHVYTIEKTKDKIVMWVDGVQTAQYGPNSPSWYSSYYEMNKHWNLRVNLQIGGTWGGLPDGTTNWSGDNTSMQLDYIHTWRLT